LHPKEARVEFRVLDPDTGKTWRVNPVIWLTRRQVEKMPSRPDMILQFVHHLDRDLSAIPRSLAPADWIGPLDHALKPGHFLP